MRASWSLALALALALTTHAPSAGSAAPAAQPSRTAPQRLLAAIPDQAVAAVLIDKDALSLPLTLLQRQPELRADISAYFTRVLGVDLTQIDGAVLFALSLKDQPVIGGLLRLSTPPALRGRTTRRIAGVNAVALQKDLYAVSTPGGVAFGHEAALAALLQRLQGKAPPLSAASPLGALLQADGDADLVVTLSPHGPVDRNLSEAAARFGVTGATLSLRGSGPLRLVLLGDPARLTGLRDLYLAASSQALNELRQRRDRAQTREDMEGLGQIIAYHSARQTIQEMEPRLLNGKLVSEYQPPLLREGGAGALVPMLGVLSAIAIPSFIKYIRRSKSVEAKTNLRRAYDGVVALSATADTSSFRFPMNTDWTPAAPCCKQPGGSCQPDPSAFSHPTWKALHFSMDTPHAFQYRFQSEGQGPGARFLVEARGDLNCDGVFSSYRREGRLDAQGLIQSNGIQTDNELE